MKRVAIDGRTIAGEDGLHDLLARELGLPAHYGRNLDALWDCLTGEVPLPLEIVWTHVSAARRRLGERAERWLELFRDAAERIEGFRFVEHDGEDAGPDDGVSGGRREGRAAGC